VSLDYIIYCAFYSILFRGAVFFPDTVYILINVVSVFLLTNY